MDNVCIYVYECVGSNGYICVYVYLCGCEQEEVYMCMSVCVEESTWV